MPWTQLLSLKSGLGHLAAIRPWVFTCPLCTCLICKKMVMIRTFTWVMREMRRPRTKSLKHCMAHRKHSVHVSSNLFQERKPVHQSPALGLESPASAIWVRLRPISGGGVGGLVSHEAWSHQEPLSRPG